MRTAAGPRLAVAYALAASICFGDSAVWAADPTVDECLEAHQRAQRMVKAGELRAARQKLLRCQESACPAVVREDCRERYAAVEKATPTIVFVALDSRGNELNLAAVRATIDDLPLPDQLSPTPIAVDPGDHALRLEYLGLPPASRKVTILEGEKGRRVVVSFPAPDIAGKSIVAVAGSDGRGPEAASRAADLSLEIGVRVGYSAGPLGTYASSLKENYGFKGAVPFGLDVGFRIAGSLYVGAFSEYSPGTPDCPAPDSGTVSCSLHDERLGAAAQYHARAASNLDPWVGLGGGAEWLSAKKAASVSAQPLWVASSGAFADLCFGLDVRSSHFAVGPYGSVSVGEFDGTSYEWLTAGLRGTFEAMRLSP
jgi:hypothetical protein